jgi:hypothetical protein
MVEMPMIIRNGRERERERESKAERKKEKNIFLQDFRSSRMDEVERVL